MFSPSHLRRFSAAAAAEPLPNEASSPPFPPALSQVTSTKLLACYLRHGLVDNARHLFDEMPQRGVVAWNSMISGFASKGLHHEAWGMFKEMLREAVEPNAFTASSVLSACGGLRDVLLGKLVHGVAVKNGLVGDMHVDNLLLHMYSICDGESMNNALAVFESIDNKSAVAWTMMISGYNRTGNGSTAIALFCRMVQEGVNVTSFSCSSAIRACAMQRSLGLGRQMHSIVTKLTLDGNVPVANSLLDMYCRCSSLEEARKWFGEMPMKDLISWNTMIGCLARCCPPEALKMSFYMCLENFQPNGVTMCSIVSACTSLGVLRCGQKFHGSAVKRGYGLTLPVANALIDMYAKSGNVVDSRQVFDEMPRKDLVSWTSIMNGYGTHGYAKEAIELFDTMVALGLSIDHIVLVGVLNACSHAGLVDEGLNYFHNMYSLYGINPTQEIYGCVIDLLSRAGRVEEAYELIQKMPFEPDESVWGALLGACRIHKNVSLGKLAASKILSLKPNEPETYIMLSNIYAADGEWDHFAKTRRKLKEKGIHKEVGRSWIEVGEIVHSFCVEDRCSPQAHFVYDVLRILLRHMEDEFMPDSL